MFFAQGGQNGSQMNYIVDFFIFDNSFIRLFIRDIEFVILALDLWIVLKKISSNYLGLAKVTNESFGQSCANLASATSN